MSRRQLLRDWIDAQPRPPLGAEIIAAFPLEKNVGPAIGAMVRAGILAQLGSNRLARYIVARDAADTATITKLEAKRRKTERDRQRHNERGRLTLAEYRAGLAITKDANAAARREKRNARRRVAEVKHPGKPVFREGRQLRVLDQSLRASAKPLQVAIGDLSADVRAFKASGGEVQVLARGEVSEAGRLKHIGR